MVQDKWNYGGSRYGLRTLFLGACLVLFSACSYYVTWRGFKGKPVGVLGVLVFSLILGIIFYGVVCFVWKSNLKASYRKEFYSALAVGFAALTFFYLGSIFQAGAQAEVEFSRDDKLFEVKTDNISSGELKKFMMSYSVLDEKGTLTFQIHKKSTENSSGLILLVPFDLHLSVVSVSLDSLSIEKSVEYIADKFSDSNIVIISPSNSSAGRYEVVTELTGALLPQGHYRFYSNLRPAKAPQEQYRTILELGDFRCQTVCWGDTYHTKPEVISTGEAIQLDFEQNENFNAFNHQVVLNTVNVKAENARASMENFWIGFFIGGMTFIVESFVLFMNVYFEGHYSHKTRTRRGGDR